MRRLLPTPDDHCDVRAAYDVTRPSLPGRPWIGLCMVASVDGSTVVDHRSAALSSTADREVLSTLRSLADMILVGASTVRVEGYRPPRKAGQRVGVVSRTGSGLDPADPLFAGGAGFLILPTDAPPNPIESVRAGTGEVDLAGAMTQIKDGVAGFAGVGGGFVQAEGGAVLNGSLLDAGLIDELNLTTSPVLAGGVGPRLITGAAPTMRSMRLAHLLEDDGFLFARYVRA